jgi:hypothetical protein
MLWETLRFRGTQIEKHRYRAFNLIAPVTDHLSNYINPGPSQEAERSSATQEIPRSLCNP